MGVDTDQSPLCWSEGREEIPHFARLHYPLEHRLDIVGADKTATEEAAYASRAAARGGRRAGGLRAPFKGFAAAVSHPGTGDAARYDRAMPERHFPPPWSVEELDSCFVVKDANG
jgi:hypothetical protein